MKKQSETRRTTTVNGTMTREPRPGTSYDLLLHYDEFNRRGDGAKAKKYDGTRLRRPSEKFIINAEERGRL